MESEFKDKAMSSKSTVPLLREIYEKPGKKKMAQNPFQPKGQPSKPGEKYGDSSDFRKNAISRRIAKMTKNNDKGKKDAGNPRA